MINCYAPNQSQWLSSLYGAEVYIQEAIWWKSQTRYSVERLLVFHHTTTSILAGLYCIHTTLCQATTTEEF